LEICHFSAGEFQDQAVWESDALVRSGSSIPARSQQRPLVSPSECQFHTEPISMAEALFLLNASIRKRFHEPLNPLDTGITALRRLPQSGGVRDERLCPQLSVRFPIS